MSRRARVSRVRWHFDHDTAATATRDGELVGHVDRWVNLEQYAIGNRWSAYVIILRCASTHSEKVSKRRRVDAKRWVECQLAKLPTMSSAEKLCSIHGGDRRARHGRVSA